jgi:L-cysteine/cystine lyase
MEAALKPRTRLVVVSHVLWNTGTLLPIEEMQHLCRLRSILLLVDGAQSAGVLPINLEQLNLDAFALPGHKWLGGPEGIGSLYISPAALDRIAPTFVGWRSVQAGQNGALGEWEPGATRFEAATAPFPLMAGLRRAIALHQEWGSNSERYERLQQLTHRLYAGISQALGLTLLTPAPAPAGIVSFTSKSAPHAEIVRSLEERNIMVRTIPSPDCIRACVHYLNTEREVDDLIAALACAK